MLAARVLVLLWSLNKNHYGNRLNYQLIKIITGTCIFNMHITLRVKRPALVADDLSEPVSSFGSNRHRLP